MSRRRSRLEIILVILSAIRDGVDKPTHIMYAASMSWKPVQRILSHMVEHDLIVESFNTESKQSMKRYQITEKGKKILDYFDIVNKILPLEVLFAGE